MAGEDDLQFGEGAFHLALTVDAVGGTDAVDDLSERLELGFLLLEQQLVLDVFLVVGIVPVVGELGAEEAESEALVDELFAVEELLGEEFAEFLGVVGGEDVLLESGCSFFDVLAGHVADGGVVDVLEELAFGDSVEGFGAVFGGEEGVEDDAVSGVYVLRFSLFHLFKGFYL